MNSSDPPGGLNGVAQCSLLPRCPASSGCISMRLGRDWEKAGEKCGLLVQSLGLDSQEQAQSCSCRCFSNEWLSFALAGYVSLVPVQGIKMEISFRLCNLPLQRKPAEVFFFLSFMINTRACGGHKIPSATSWLKQLVVLFVKVQFSFWGKSIQLIT